MESCLIVDISDYSSYESRECNVDFSTATLVQLVLVADRWTSLLALFQAQLAIVLLGNPVALTGGLFKFLAIHDLHCTAGVLD